MTAILIPYSCYLAIRVHGASGEKFPRILQWPIVALASQIPRFYLRQTDGATYAISPCPLDLTQSIHFNVSTNGWPDIKTAMTLHGSRIRQASE